MTRPTTARWARTAAALLTVLAVACACGDGDERSGPTPSTIGPGVELVEGTGLTLDPASGFGAVGALEPVEGPDSCRGWRGSVVGGDGDTGIEIALWGPGCVVTEGLNGQRVQYRAASDVLSGEVVETRQVAAGTASAIADVYVECTNDCDEYEDRIALVELDAPADERFPGVMISTIDDVPFDDLMAIAASLQVGAAG